MLRFQLKRSAILLGFLSLAASAVAASYPTTNQTMTPTSQPLRLDMLRAGYGLVLSNKAGLPDYIWGTARVRNDTASFVVMYAELTVFGTDGSVIEQSGGSALIARPHAVVAVGAPAYVPRGSNVASVKVTVTPIEALSGTSLQGLVFSAHGVRFRPEAFGGSVLGSASSGSAHKAYQVYVGVICYDSAMKIIGGGDTFIPSIASKAKRGFEAGVFTTGAPASCEALPTLSALSVPL